MAVESINIRLECDECGEIIIAQGDVRGTPLMAELGHKARTAVPRTPLLHIINEAIQTVIAFWDQMSTDRADGWSVIADESTYRILCNECGPEEHNDGLD